MHTSQGLKFDYVGVIIGNDLRYDSETMTLYADYNEFKSPLFSVCIAAYARIGQVRWGALHHHLGVFELTLLDMIGKRMRRDLFSEGGVLLVPASTILTGEHLDVLDKHAVVITPEDVTTIDTYTEGATGEYAELIHEAVAEVRQIFEQVRETRSFALADLRNNVIPIIQETAIQGTPLIELFASLQAKDDYTYRHHIGVGAIASLIGSWLGLGHKDLLQLTTAALLHDIGKMLIPEAVLNKPGKLTPEENIMMRHHTVLGYELLKGTVGVTHRQALVALQHHERLDGSGYPFGLAGDRIELFSRIVSVADIFHAMTSKRVYRDPSPFYEVLYQMEHDTFGVLDPRITRLLMQKLMQSLIGHKVILTDESEGVILMINMHAPIHPLIQVDNQYIDLSKNYSLHIRQIRNE